MSKGSSTDKAPPQATSPPPSPEHDSPEDEALRGSARLKNPESLVRLRDRVKKTAQELERLRQENRALRERIEHLEARPTIDIDGSVLTFEEAPDILRGKIESFIEAIDTYLAQEND